MRMRRRKSKKWSRRNIRGMRRITLGRRYGESLSKRKQRKRRKQKEKEADKMETEKNEPEEEVLIIH